MNNIQGGHVTCYICEVQAFAPQFSNSPWTGKIVIRQPQVMNSRRTDFLRSKAWLNGNRFTERRKAKGALTHQPAFS